MSSIDSVAGITRAEHNEPAAFAERNGAAEKDAGFSDALIDAMTRDDDSKGASAENAPGAEPPGDGAADSGKFEYPPIN